MIDYVWGILLFIGLGGLYFWIDRQSSSPNVCPNCEKEYQNLEKWSYADYSWGLRCPHCKHPFDNTP